MSARSRIFVLAGALLLIAYAIVLFHHTSRSVGGSDSSGYLNAARLFASGRVTEPIRGLERLGLPQDLARVFVPLGYAPLERAGRMAPSYPPGWPLHMALAAKLGGWATAPFLVSPIAGLASLVLMYFLGRELRLPPSFAFAGAALLAFFPTFVYLTLQPMSDVVATAWALAAVLAAYRFRASFRVGWAVAAGAAFGIGVLVRPTNVLVFLPLLFVFPPRWKAWVGFVSGGMLCAIFLFAYNTALFGNPLTTGYGSILGSLAWSDFPQRARHYAYWTGRLLTPVLPLGWLALGFDRHAPVRDRAALLVWFSAFFLFYSFYPPYETWWYTRFLLPGIPATILGACVAARDFILPGGRSRPARWSTAATLVLLAAALFVEVDFTEKHRVHRLYKSERIYPRACAMARRRIPSNGIIASMQMSGALHYYTDLTYAMWNWLDSERFALLRSSTESRGYRWYALLTPFEVPEVAKNLPGDWRAIDRTGDVVLWELPPAPRPIGSGPFVAPRPDEDPEIRRHGAADITDGRGRARSASRARCQRSGGERSFG
jgi:hypothetical protein